MENKWVANKLAFGERLLGIDISKSLFFINAIFMSFTFFITQLAFRSEPLVSIGATHGKIIKGIGNILD